MLISLLVQKATIGPYTQPDDFISHPIDSFVTLHVILRLCLCLSSFLSFQVFGLKLYVIFLKYNQQDATLYNILYYCQCPTCFRRFLRPSSGAHKLYTKHQVNVELACCYR